jgi:hypothetical protein
MGLTDRARDQLVLKKEKDRDSSLAGYIVAVLVLLGITVLAVRACEVWVRHAAADARSYARSTSEPEIDDAHVVLNVDLPKNHVRPPLFPMLRQATLFRPSGRRIAH